MHFLKSKLSKINFLKKWNELDHPQNYVPYAKLSLVTFRSNRKIMHNINHAWLMQVQTKNFRQKLFRKWITDGLEQT